MKTILLAEDEWAIREGLIDLLESEGYAVLAAADGEAALSFWKERKPDLALLDIMMPKLSGYDVCRDIRKTDERIPVIFLSARDEEIDKVLGLELGADDYIVKPFGVRELAARVRAALRRSEREGMYPADSESAPFTFGDCTVDPLRFTLEVRRNNEARTFSLTVREVDLLRWFFTHPETVHTRENLLERFWGVRYEGTTRTLDQHIAKIRQKIEIDCASPRHILTVHGAGYRFRL